MPGPAFGLTVTDWDSRTLLPKNVAEYKGRRYLTMHTHCANGASCTGQGCRANTGKTRASRGR